MSECSHNCASCSENCGERTAPESMLAPENPHSNVRKVIGIVSGKGGVGKSLVTSMLAVLMRRKGYETAILDADITGPSIPKIFHLTERATGSEEGIFPVQSKLGTKVMSINLLLPDETEPVVWRGPVIGNAVTQFWSDVMWGDVDFMFVDMPPGTGDVPLTVFQSLPVDGIIVVTSPQDLVSMIVGKAVKMAQKMNVPILGVVENYSYLACPDCGKHISVFGESHVEEAAEKYGLPVLAKLPIDPAVAAACDSGMIELFDGDWLDGTVEMLEKL
ncbi:Mrp/NBP35 family ATP-binding protein [Phocea massiliensis]|uniref:Iron-sulfur cluster carrier protein n=1 Tax=Merdimmobilis hominis TaxID=2897707 RepID=A0A938X6L8_9FIRM|nr:Mrp/NBP35 family ATP-binding protein [Merdimmobilis hominis]MBM6921151.1 Mrp/NBP35 family ATP-binding protein [Merdimmobilis hominis]